MTWTHDCHLPIFESEEAENEYLKEREAAYAKRVAEREQVITTEKRPYPHRGLSEKQRQKNPHPTYLWYASLAGDWRKGTGDTEERAIGDLWLMYAHEIIEKCKTLETKQGGQQA